MGGGHQTSLEIVSVWEGLTRATVFFVPKFGRKVTRLHLRGETGPPIIGGEVRSPIRTKFGSKISRGAMFFRTKCDFLRFFRKKSVISHPDQSLASPSAMCEIRTNLGLGIPPAYTDLPHVFHMWLLIR